ncbi:CRR6 family NdhI maturation factor [Kovacikia minuta CCNUW1]|uniref:CRR6 family NdhI maturation factor n=1 Tax=Kovacikia minuta TaxID=2931930 RepID=UPI001CCFBD24|nr:CRR6 family NdhI maturation factor [Kovacikia minuta]UBF29363.1 CRR6 family NdhI maturation factor [Kovacikia minuta CCNUW1]
MSLTIALLPDSIHSLDLTPALVAIEPLLEKELLEPQTQQLQFQIDYPRAPEDPRELSEIPEIRLWFIRLDSLYPWLPFLLDWKAGELVRYTAMLVPHQFHPKDGIQFNPEALEIFVMQKVFVITAWLKHQKIEGKSRLKSMTQMLGYELDDGLFDVLNR